jgi:hypothetical protein
VLLTLALGLMAWPVKLRFSLECGMLASGLAVRPVMGGDGWYWVGCRAVVCLEVFAMLSYDLSGGGETMMGDVPGG